MDESLSFEISDQWRSTDRVNSIKTPGAQGYHQQLYIYLYNYIQDCLKDLWNQTIVVKPKAHFKDLFSSHEYSPLPCLFWVITIVLALSLATSALPRSKLTHLGWLDLGTMVNMQVNWYKILVKGSSRLRLHTIIMESLAQSRFIEILDLSYSLQVPKQKYRVPTFKPYSKGV